MVQVASKDLKAARSWAVRPCSEHLLCGQRFQSSGLAISTVQGSMQPVRAAVEGANRPNSICQGLDGDQSNKRQVLQLQAWKHV